MKTEIERPEEYPMVVNDDGAFERVIQTAISCVAICFCTVIICITIYNVVGVIHE